MKVYLTRHGQVLPDKFTGTVDCPDGDIALSDLGEKQAEFLGKELALRNFKGIIISSPYLRTMTTAEAVASACDVKIYPEAVFREGVFSTKEIMSLKGMTLEELKERFPHVAEDAELEYPWWTIEIEDNPEAFSKRVDPLLDHLLASDHKEILLVGHGASVGATVRYFMRKFGFEKPSGLKNVNCNLTEFELDDNGELVRAVLFGNAHLPDEYLTSNTNKIDRFVPFVLEREGK